MTRERKVLAGNPEECGALTEKRPCNTALCVRPCKTSKWGVWGKCKGKCNYGVQVRARAVVKKALNGGPCVQLKEQKKCTLQQRCPVACKVSAWSPWTKCPSSCANKKGKLAGMQQRTRKINQKGDQCPVLKETKPCVAKPCPRACALGKWGKWATCSKACGGGTQKRTRKVLKAAKSNGAACGILSMGRSCKTKPCANPCKVGTWSAWSKCSKSCGGGTKVRSRKIVAPAKNGGKCVAPLKMSKKCSKKACPVDCVMSSWTKFSKCSSSCGQGKQVRKRKVKNHSAHGGKACGPKSETRQCKSSKLCTPKQKVKALKKEKKILKKEMKAQAGTENSLAKALAKQATLKKKELKTTLLAQKATKKIKQAEKEKAKANKKLIPPTLGSVATLAKKALAMKSVAAKAKVMKEIERMVEKVKKGGSPGRLKLRESLSRTPSKTALIKADLRKSDAQAKAATLEAKREKSEEKVVSLKLQKVSRTVDALKAKEQQLAAGMLKTQKALNQTLATKLRKKSSAKLQQKSKPKKVPGKPVAKAKRKATKKVPKRKATKKTPKRRNARSKKKRNTQSKKARKKKRPQKKTEQKLEKIVQKAKRIGQQRERYLAERKAAAAKEARKDLAKERRLEAQAKEAQRAIKDIKVAYRRAKNEMKRAKAKAIRAKSRIPKGGSATKGAVQNATQNATNVANSTRNHTGKSTKIANDQQNSKFVKVARTATRQYQKAATKVRQLRQKMISLKVAKNKLRGSATRAQADAGVAQTSVAALQAADNLAKLKTACVGKTCTGLNALKKKAQLAKRDVAQAARDAGKVLVQTRNMRCGDGQLQQERGEECDDGGVRGGDGCDSKCRVEKGWSCAAGSWAHQSECDKCGNGQLRGQEECDDGNTAAGDGCSKDCKIEKGNTCKVMNSKGKWRTSICSRLDVSEAEGLVKKLQRLSVACRRKGKFFLAGDANDPRKAGGCTRMSPLSAAIQMESSVAGTLSPLAPLTTYTISKYGRQLTCPIALDGNGGEAYAVCSVAQNEVCPPAAMGSSICSYQRTLRCEEVCTAPRFCAAPDAGLGRLVHRQHGERTPNGRACCFSGCAVPPSWTVNGDGIDPSFWCMTLAQAGA